MKPNDSEIVERFLKGDKNIFNSIVDEHTKFVFNICYSLLKNIHDSEDVSQDVFILVYKNLNEFKKLSSLKTWIYKITYNECLRFLKRRKKYVEIEFDETKNTSEIQSLIIENDEKIISVLNESIFELNPIESLVINLFYNREQSLKEISEITSLSNSNIRVILHRSRNKLLHTINQKLKSRGE